MTQHCLFAHFDKDDKVADYVLRYLGEIKRVGFSIVFISSARPGGPDLERLRGCCDDIMLRDNAGLDFGSWSDGFAKHRRAIGGRLLLANDSVYGPIGSLAAALDRLTARPADFYGMVESLEPIPHLQSWFLLFEPRVVAGEAFAAIMSQPFSAMSKQQIIRDNPIRVEDAATVLRAVDSIDPSFTRLIGAHLARMAGRQAQGQRPFWSRRRHALIRQRYACSRKIVPSCAP